MIDLTHARALTLLNPWAWAITNAGKRIENRSCRCGDWAAAGQYHWQLGRVTVLADPVRVPRGAQRTWAPAPEFVSAIARQVS
jgi:hypothetical protein